MDRRGTADPTHVDANGATDPAWSGGGTWATVAHSRLTCRRQPRMLVDGATRPHLARQGSLPVLRRAGLDEPAFHAHRQRASSHKTDRYGPHARAEEARSRHKSTIHVRAVCPPIDRGRGNGPVRSAPGRVYPEDERAVALCRSAYLGDSVAGQCETARARSPVDEALPMRSSQAFVIDFLCLSRSAINSARCRSSLPSRMLRSSGSART
jgi:hypothetical protein